jgi:hypothetical protein
MIQENKFPYEYDGYEPHSRAPGYNQYNQLPARVRELFSECFSESAKNLDKAALLYGEGRPKPREWIEAFENIFEGSTGQGKDTGSDPADPPPSTVGGGSSDVDNPYDGETGDPGRTNTDNTDNISNPYDDPNATTAGNGDETPNRPNSDRGMSSPYNDSNTTNDNGDRDNDDSDEEDSLKNPYE